MGPAFDNATMDNAVLLDASLGPPYPVPSSCSSSSSSTSSPGPAPPNTGVVASCTSRLFVGAEYGNYNGVMHGGAAGVIFDMLTTIALGPVARPGFWTFLGGVTRTLNISYLKAVPISTSPPSPPSPLPPPREGVCPTPCVSAETVSSPQIRPS